MNSFPPPHTRTPHAMVWFQCGDCGDSIKKPKLDTHFRQVTRRGGRERDGGAACAASGHREIPFTRTCPAALVCPLDSTRRVHACRRLIRALYWETPLARPLPAPLLLPVPAASTRDAR